MRLDGWANGALRQLSPLIREHFTLDPIETLTDDLHITVRPVEQLNSVRNDGGACDGVSFLEDGVVLFAPSHHSKRQYFTLAHELGHWLVEHDDTLLNWLADQDDAAHLLETVCDAIAQRLLLPNDLIDSVVEAPVRAKHILELSDQSVASVPASAIAVTSRLPHMGATVIIDRYSRTVTSSTVHPDPEMGWPTIYPWRGDVVSDNHSLLGLADGRSMTRKSFWRSRWGKREDFYIDAIALPNRTIAVLSATDLWRIEALPTLDIREWDRRPVGELYCCGQQRKVRGWPCPNCGRQFCPVCGGCNCTVHRRSEAECSECHTLVASHLLVDGKCELCA